MATGVKYNNAAVGEGASWQDRFNVAAATAALMQNVLTLGADGNVKVIAWYDSSTAFSSTAAAACINFPRGSIVYDIQGEKVYMKTAAAGTSTWKYGAIAS
jgi:hypothetical protein